MIPSPDLLQAVQLEDLVIENAESTDWDTHRHFGLTMVFGVGLRINLDQGICLLKLHLLVKVYF